MAEHATRGSHGHHPHQNYLLRALPSDARARIFPHLQLVDMPPRQILYDGDTPLEDVYFPTDAVIAPLHQVAGDAWAQIAVIGNEGVTGLGLSLGGKAAMMRALVQCPGHAFQLGARLLQQECARHGALYRLLLRYRQALLAQMGQTLACRANHSLDQRLCRWLLLSLDRVGANQLPIQPEFIRTVLGVSGDEIRGSLQTLDSLGLLRQGPEHLLVPDRRRLEQASCECYSWVRDEFERLLPPHRDKLMDGVPSLASALINGMSAANQRELITQVQNALVVAVTFDPDADTYYVDLESEESQQPVQGSRVDTRQAKRTPIECACWVNIDTDRLGRIVTIEVMHPPPPLKNEMMSLVKSGRASTSVSGYIRRR
jgi:uncharacterized protein YuzE